MIFLEQDFSIEEYEREYKRLSASSELDGQDRSSGSKKSTAARSESRECGANAEGGGGFQPGNTCGKGDGGGGGSQFSSTAAEFGIDAKGVSLVSDKEMDAKYGKEVLGNFNKQTGEISVRQTLPDGWTHDDVLRHEAMHYRFESFHKSGKMTKELRDSLNAERYSPSPYSDAVWSKVEGYSQSPGGIHAGSGRAMFDHAVNETLAEMARAGGVFDETPDAWAKLYRAVLRK